MNCIHNTDRRADSRARLTNGLMNQEGQRRLTDVSGVQKKNSGRVKPIVSWIAICALLCSPFVPAFGGLVKGGVDFSNYNVSSYEQIVNRIKAKVAARLGEGENKQDRNFIVPFAYQNKGNSPSFSH